MKKNGSTVSVAIAWEKAPTDGSIAVINGSLAKLRVTGGQGKATQEAFMFKNSPGRMKRRSTKSYEDRKIN